MDSLNRRSVNGMGGVPGEGVVSQMEGGVHDVVSWSAVMLVLSGIGSGGTPERLSSSSSGVLTGSSDAWLLNVSSSAGSHSKSGSSDMPNPNMPECDDGSKRGLESGMRLSSDVLAKP